MKLRLQFIGILLLAFGCAIGKLPAADAPHGAPALLQKPDPSIIELTGRLVKLPEGTNSIGLQTAAGAVYPLRRTEASEAQFLDPELLTRTLILKGRVEPKTGFFEVIGNLHSLRDGKRRELYYYCDVCAIKSSTPGLCMCCREPMKLVEKP